jgi:hypothetical protein
MRALMLGAAVLLVAATPAATASAAVLLVAATPAATAKGPAPPVVVLTPIAGTAASPATGQKAVAVARSNGVPSALARPYRAELGWTAQWQGSQWWLVGVYESDWGTRFVVRAAVRGRHASYGVGPTRQWIVTNAQPQVTTLYTRFDPASAVAAMESAMLAQPTPEPGSYPNFDPRNYTILDGAATLVRDEPEEGGRWGSGPGWWFVYYARDHRTGQNVVLPVTGAGYDPPAPEGPGFRSAYGFTDFWVRNDVRPAVPAVDDWIDSVVAARGWHPAGWPSTGRDETFLSIPPFVPRPPFEVRSRAGGTAPDPATAASAVALLHENLDVADALAAPAVGDGNWTAQWRGHSWWLAGVFRSPWGRRFVVRAEVAGSRVDFGAGPGRKWLLAHAHPRLRNTVFTRLNPWSAALLLKAELLASPSQFDQHRYSILTEAARLVRDSPPALDAGPAWSFVLYARDLASGKKVVLPVTSRAHGPLVETAYHDATTPGATAYGFQGFDVLPKVPAKSVSLARWIRRVVATRGWHPANFH